MNIKSVSTKKHIKPYIELLNKANAPFSIKVSNYTTKLTSDIVNATFMKSERGNRFFAAYAKMKSNISKHKPPRVNKEKVKFFEHTFTKDCFFKEVMNIDLSNAYATVLYNDGFITKETFEYINAMNKTDRLASIGMLASQNLQFDYEMGQLKKFSINTSKYQNYFYYCVDKVHKIMLQSKKRVQRDFLYIWVDSIYFKPNEQGRDEIISFLKENGFQCKTQTLRDFSVDYLKSKIRLSYTVEGDKEQTVFYIPPKTSDFAHAVASYITKLNIKP